MAWLDWSLDKLFSCIIIVILSSPANDNNNKINFSFSFFLGGFRKSTRLSWVWRYYKYTRRRCCYCCFRVQVPGCQAMGLSRETQISPSVCHDFSSIRSHSENNTAMVHLSFNIHCPLWIDIAMKGEKSRSSSLVLADHFDRQLDDNKSISLKKK